VFNSKVLKLNISKIIKKREETFEGKHEPPSGRLDFYFFTQTDKQKIKVSYF
jgi:hypothetical protein